MATSNIKALISGELSKVWELVFEMLKIMEHGEAT